MSTKRQVSKRSRDSHNHKAHRAVIEGIRTPYGRDKLWIYRQVGAASTRSLSSAAEKHLDSPQVTAKTSFTLSLLYPAEVLKAIRRSKLKGLVSTRGIADHLVFGLPDCLADPVTATVEDVRQYQGRIGLKVNYPGYAEERNLITSGLNRCLNERYTWDVGEPHISVAIGRLSDVADITAFKAAVPSEISLTRSFSSFNNLTVT